MTRAAIMARRSAAARAGCRPPCDSIPSSPSLRSVQKNRRDVAVRQAAHKGQGSLIRRRDGLAAQHATQRLDLAGRPVRQIGERALPDLVAFAIALPEQDRRRRVATGYAFDVHGQLESSLLAAVKPAKQQIHGYKSGPARPFRFPFNGLAQKPG